MRKASVGMKKLFYWNVLTILFILFWMPASNVAAATEPSEVERIKEEATLHVIGRVTTHQLVEDRSEKGEPKQKRRFTLSITQMIKSPSDLKDSDSIEVFYTYIPNWSTNQYNGSDFLDIETGDVIEIWLNKTSEGWESALGAATYEHKTYVNNRTELIPEPFANRFNRIIEERIIDGPFLPIIVLMLLVASLFIIGLLSIKQKKTPY
ncbi:hypothetical protein GLW08_02730 [Pontibacillus yanchengensis]|uniref:Uncharacterized protein n=2 Tax=Pontibacillus yanchengensis TaxID=462910 RepID=A0A6I4ZX57_9BACI|nr:hypothetical protein [Pontibacillus yanchengensis]MYL34765.1 hypothetical protein [Pontibacillus yanchengensis]MYL52249.1 hypothetical protein [Pontibacillus yanchengensis]